MRRRRISSRPDCGIEPPLAGLLHDRNRHRPVFVPHGEGGDLRVLRIPDDLGLLAGLRGEGDALIPVLYRVGANHEVHAVRSEDLLQSREIVVFGREDQSLGRRLGGLERLLRDRRGRRGRCAGLRGARNRPQQRCAQHAQAQPKAPGMAYESGRSPGRLDLHVIVITSVLRRLVRRRHLAPLPPPRDPMLEAPRELLARALLPL